eukprot:1380197-Pleurochrysis_carterae.AAC.1
MKRANPSGPGNAIGFGSEPGRAPADDCLLCCIIHYSTCLSSHFQILYSKRDIHIHRTNGCLCLGQEAVRKQTVLACQPAHPLMARAE